MGSDSSAPVGIGGSIDVLGWLRTLPVAPEYHPTLAEFQDPIGYIFKIEKEASKYGICKIVPPVAPQSRKTTVSNLNRSLSARSPVGSPTFTTRQQQIGFCPRKHHPIQKPVWQSGEEYTVQEFEAKAKAFEKTYLRKCSKKNLNALEIETIYWKAIVDKPFSVEYANDMPGSAFAQRKPAAKHGGEGSVADTDWNMRGVSRARGSLLKFMKEEIPGVTSPMVYLAMMLSWFAWHVEDHDFHSLNYLHMGSGKTWYGVPRDAAAACEEVIRAHGYGGEINPLVTFSTLGEKTTVMSPEVLIDAGVPCCRLVQNAGEFVVTFPRAYHSGFSHGFNCGEAANIATPGWLTGAKEAAIRRASINQPPMVSHFQLLYDLALSSCSSVMKDTHLEPRSSRLKDKRRGEGEMLVKDLFVQDLLQNSNLLELLSKGSSVIILPENSPESGPSSKSGLQSYVERKKRDVKGRYSSLKQKVSPPCNDERPLYSSRGHEASMSSQFKNRETGEDRPSRADRSSEQGLFSCVTCGILCYACVAVIKPTNVAAGYLKTADCNQYKDWEIDNEALPIREQGKLVNLDSSPENVASEEPTDVNMGGLVSNAEVQNGASSLGLLALAYGNSSDTEEDEGEAEANDETNQPTAIDCSAESGLNGDDTCSIDEEAACTEIISAGEVPLQVTNNLKSATASSGHGSLEEDSCRFFSLMDSGSLTDISKHDMRSKDASSFSSVTHKVDKAITTASEQLGNIFSCATGPDEDSSRMHVFCLQHAIQVEKQLHTIGGAHVLLLCHPDYPEFEAQAKNMAEEFEDYNDWGHVSYRHASKDDEDVIQLALQSEEAVHGNGDWAVKLGINLFYSANLSRSPLYSKQMPYNSIIYKAFGRNAPTNDHTHGDRVPGRQRKVPVGGKWCGKVWMSNQIHPLLIQNVQLEEQKSTPSRVKPASKTVASRVKPAVKTDPSSVKPALRAPSSRVKPALRAPPSRVKPALRTPSSRVKPASRPVSKPERLSGRPVSKPERFSGRSRSVTAETVAGKKRKATAEIRPTVKAKSARAEVSDEESEDLPLKHTFKSCQRKRQMTIQTPEARSVKNRIQLKDSGSGSGSGSGSDSGSDSGSESESEEEQEGPPSTRLRKRPEKPVKDQKVSKPAPKKPPQVVGKPKKSAAGSNSSKSKEETFEYVCDIEGCTSSFETKQELALHKRNTCPVKSCGKKFFSHKYLVQHRRVHNDDRPLKCPWKGCKMSFKWAWARTEHIRVHTGARPYVCSEAGCGQTFRFVSDFSRHKRKTGHCANKKSKG